MFLLKNFLDNKKDKSNNNSIIYRKKLMLIKWIQ